MNQNIEKLVACIPTDTSGRWVYIGDMEKFAELIIRECAQKGFNVFDEEPDAPASDLQYYVRDGIKKHFGVEE